MGWNKTRTQENRGIQEKDITFKELRNYLSIGMLETLCYENFLFMDDVPYAYDCYYVYGIGMIES